MNQLKISDLGALPQPVHLESKDGINTIIVGSK